MIIGDGIMLGTGGDTSSIIVTAPTGSTVTCTTPGGIVLTATEVSGTWTFTKLKVYGTYTVTATNGTKTATQDALVDSAEQYHIELDYNLWLYKDGVSYAFENFHAFGVPTAYGHNWSVAGKITNSLIDISNYTKLCFEGPYESTSNTHPIILSDSSSINNWYSGESSWTLDSTKKHGDYLLSNITAKGSYYIAVGSRVAYGDDSAVVVDYDTYFKTYSTSYSNYEGYYSRVWLE